jgi:hypothetical protein
MMKTRVAVALLLTAIVIATAGCAVRLFSPETHYHHPAPPPQASAPAAQHDPGAVAKGAEEPFAAACEEQ